MRFAQRQAAVNLVEGGHALFADGVGRTDGLAAATDAAAWAGHDFDEVIGAGALLDLFHDAAGIAQCMGNADADLTPVDVYAAFLDAFEAADFVERKFFECLASEFFVDCAQGSFHDTASCAEDSSGTGCKA